MAPDCCKGWVGVPVTCHNFIFTTQLISISLVHNTKYFVCLNSDISRVYEPLACIRTVDIFPTDLILNFTFEWESGNNDGISGNNGDTNWATPWVPSPELLTLLSPSSVTLSHPPSVRLISNWPCDYCLTIHLKCCVNYRAILRDNLVINLW